MKEFDYNQYIRRSDIMNAVIFLVQIDEPTIHNKKTFDFHLENWRNLTKIEGIPVVSIKDKKNDPDKVRLTFTFSDESYHWKIYRYDAERIVEWIKRHTIEE